MTIFIKGNISSSLNGNLRMYSYEGGTTRAVVILKKTRNFAEKSAAFAHNNAMNFYNK